ncbi:hypothetical protein BN1232_06142 [Mycobacterium lentiflavum]|uniref:Uncharacterized protein n=1 Tax=Mycobacterium lentiflavum TaxID=141349 RepID=A0A0E4CRB7_MYCLN|nr:hypothetical protein [Mycobacterium lentiflavum]CQD24285.1 hypothetical protein BN1232_06142 [Mycobacterium lentiflavum]
MPSTAAATHVMPPAIITHSTVALRGQQRGLDITVHHARTPDARIGITFNGLQMAIYSCHAAQGLLAASTAARGQMIHLPRQIPSPPTDPHETDARVVLSVEWTRRPVYSVVAQSAVNKLKTGRVNWLDLYTGPITWQIRDQAALLSMIELLTRAHKTATAIFADGEQYDADPTSPDYHAA